MKLGSITILVPLVCASRSEDSPARANELIVCGGLDVNSGIRSGCAATGSAQG